MPQGPALAIALAGPLAPNPDAPPPSRDLTLARRSAVATIGAGLILVAAGAAKSATVAASPDAGLLRLCAAFHDADARCHAAPDDTSEWQDWLARRWEISEQVEAMTPNTLPGHLAKARVALVLLEEMADIDNSGERFAMIALRDLVGSAVA